MLSRLKRHIHEIRLLLHSVPAPLLSLFVVSVIAMNLLANKSVNLPVTWLALDCGILVSWITFLSMDIVTRHFGPKAATQLSVFASLLNLLACLFFFLAAKIPGTWGESYVEGSETVINGALNRTFGGTWYVLFGSTIAFLVSALINNFLNAFIGKRLAKKKDSFAVYACRTYVSTALGQFADNLIFAGIVSHFFFGWSWLQCLTCAFTGMIAELLCEILFSRIGYRIVCQWEKDHVGELYLNYKEENRK